MCHDLKWSTLINSRSCLVILIEVLVWNRWSVLVGEQEFFLRARWTMFYVHTRLWKPPPRSGRGRWSEAFASYLRSHKSSMFHLKIRQISSIYFNITRSVISFINKVKIVVLIINIHKNSWELIRMRNKSNPWIRKHSSAYNKSARKNRKIHESHQVSVVILACLHAEPVSQVKSREQSSQRGSSWALFQLVERTPFHLIHCPYTIIPFSIVLIKHIINWKLNSIHLSFKIFVDPG